MPGGCSMIPLIQHQEIRRQKREAEKLNEAWPARAGMHHRCTLQQLQGFMGQTGSNPEKG